MYRMHDAVDLGTNKSYGTNVCAERERVPSVFEKVNAPCICGMEDFFRF